jgi:hypothetical protein
LAAALRPRPSAPPSRGAAPPQTVVSRAAGLKSIGKLTGAAESRRRYPRAALTTRARLTLASDPTRTFEAVLPTVNVSVGGVFLHSTYFLKAGTLLLVELELPPKGRKVRAKAEVVRVESTGEDQTGFALRFLEYYDGSEVVLATHFLAPVLREFLTQYAQQHQFEASPDYVAATADVLAAWELKKAELGDDVWHLRNP